MKEIRNHLYIIENKNEIEKSKEYLDELDKKIIELNELDDDFIENVRDLFNTLNYEPILIKAGYDNNYLEHRSEGNNSLSFEEYLDLIKPHLNDLINTHKNKGEWKIQLTAQINFISLRPGSDEMRVMHTRSVNEEFMNGSNTDEVIKALFKSILQKYQENLQEKMKGSDFAFDGINYLYYDLNKITISKGGSYIDSPKWLKTNKSTINSKINDYKCFPYAFMIKLVETPKEYQKLNHSLKIIIGSTRKDWNKFELNNNNITLNILYVPFNTKKIEIAYKSKHNLTRDNQIILLMISNGENWHYLAVKSLSGLFTGVTSNHKEDYYCLNCFHSYRTKNKLDAHKKVCENHEYCHIEMPNKDNNKIKYNQGEKSIKLPFIIYADLECLLEKINTCFNNPEESSTTKINHHTPSGYSIFTHCSFDKSKNKLNYYRGEDCMKRFCKDLKEHATKIINCEKKDMIPLM